MINTEEFYYSRFRETHPQKIQNKEIEKELKKLIAWMLEREDPIWDNTPFEHPAYARGQRDGVRGAVKFIKSGIVEKDKNPEALISNIKKRIQILAGRTAE